MSHQDQSLRDNKPCAPANSSYREIPPDILALLSAHEQWLETGGKEGHQADLSGADLKGLDLSGVNLKMATLSGALLTEANLADAIFQQADLSGASLNEANLLRAQFQDATLENANLENTKNLLASQLARSDLTNAKLPDPINKFPELDHFGPLAETSRNARNLLFTILVVCVYTWLTVATTTDVGLITDAATSELPIIGTSIRIAAFYMVAPLLLMALYIYFHLTLQGLYEDMSELPAFFPDGRRLDQQTYPWLLNKLVGLFFPQLKKRHIPFGLTQFLLSIFLAWMTIPLTLVIIWIRYLTRQELFGSTLHVVILAASIGFGIRSFLLIRAMLTEKSIDYFKHGLVAACVSSVVGIFLLLVCFGVIYGIPANIQNLAEEYDNRKLVPAALSIFGYSPYANLGGVDVCPKPANWTDREEHVLLVKGADLRARNLRYAWAMTAFLVKADLRQANLHRAMLMRADLREANLQEAELQGANLQEAKLHRAKLGGAKLHEANLQRAELQEACLQEAELPGATLQGAKLQKADLSVANLQAANLQEADLEGANLEKANLVMAKLHWSKLRDANLQEANLEKADFFSANLQRANLQEANLQEAKLRGADLQWTKLQRAKIQGAGFNIANLQQANLEEADLQGADLRWANFQFANLQRANLKGANLQGTKLKGANLQWAKLDEADLRGANIGWIFCDANFQRAKLRGAKLQRADLKRANLEGADLFNANIEGADLNWANLKEANLDWTNLKGADLKKAKLQKAELLGADLSDADLRGVEGLTQEQLDSAFINRSTKLPKYLKRRKK